MLLSCGKSLILRSEKRMLFRFYYIHTQNTSKNALKF